MNSANLGIILRRLHQIAPPTTEADAELLARYGRGDQEAFAVLVERYSGLVWGVGRRVLHRQQEGEDVFQATFLALSRKFNLLKGESSLAPWLYTVAVRLALKIKRRQRQETYLVEMAEPATRVDPSAEVSGREMAQMFDEEMQRLPAKYREAVVLCCLEGLSRDEAAGLACCSLSVMKNRLERGRKLLRQRLERRGIAVPITLLLVGMTNRVAPAAVRSAAYRVFESASPGVFALAGEAVAGSMIIKTILVTIALGLTAVCIGIGGSVLADPEPALKTSLAAETAQANQTATEEPAKEAKPRLDRFGDPLPNEALARFGTVRWRQGYLVTGFRFSPDEKSIAMAAGGRPLGLWDVATGKELFQLDAGPGAGDPPRGIAFSPDGTILAEGGSKDIRFWDTHTGQLLHTLKGCAGLPWVLVFAPDGKTLISAGYDQAIRYWDTATGQETAKIDTQQFGVIFALALSTDGQWLAAGGTDKIIRLWKVETRELVKEFRGHEEAIASLSFSPDGKQLASTADGRSVTGFTLNCFLWDVAKGERSHTLAAGSIAQSADSAIPTAYSPNGKWLATGGSDGTIFLWDPATGKEVRRWKTQSIDVLSLVFSKDSMTIASNSAWEGGIRFWEAETGQEKHPVTVHRAMLEDMQLSPDSRSLWSLGRDQRIIRWNVATAEPEQAILHSADTLRQRKATLAPGGAMLAWISGESIHVMDLQSRKEVCNPLKTTSPASWLCFSPDGKVLAVGCAQGLFHLWNWQTDRDPKPLKLSETGFIRPGAFTPDGRRLILGLEGVQERRLHCWDIPTGQSVSSFPGRVDFYYGLAISPDGRWAAFIDFEKHIQVIELENGKNAREIKVDPRGGSALAFSPDGRVLALGNYVKLGGNVELIEFATGEPIASFKGHHSGVLKFQFTPDGRTLYSGGGDSTILKWDGTARHGKARSTPNLEAAWQALAQDAIKAYPASWDLLDVPKRALELLRQKIKPAKKLDIKEVQPIVDLLDSDKFPSREQAAKDLQSLGYSAEPILRKLLETEKRPEVKQRLQAALDRLTHEFVRTRRTLEVLQAMNNADAKQFLHELAAGAAGNMLTGEAISRINRFAP